MGNTVIKNSRKFWIWTSLGFGFVTAEVLARFALHPDNVAALVFGLLFGALLVGSGRMAYGSRVAFSFSDQGFTIGNGGRFVAWSDVDRIHVSHSGSNHELVLHLKPGTSPLRRRFITTNETNPNEISVLLDHLSEPWQQIASQVEAAAGTPIASVTTGPFGLGTRTISPD